MAEHPLLVFPEAVPAEKAIRHGGGRPTGIPDAQKQSERLAPQFRRLQQGDNPSFKKWLSDTIFGVTYEEAGV